MTEDRSRRVAPHVEERWQAAAGPGGVLRCPACPHTTKLTPAGKVTLRVFDEFRGHLLGHDVFDFAEAAARDRRVDEYIRQELA